MRHRPRLFQRRIAPLPLRYVVLLSFFLFVLLTVQGLWLVESSIRPTLLEIAKTETEVIATEAINHAVSRKISDELEADELMIIERDPNGYVTSIQWDTQIITRVLAESTDRVQRYLRAVEAGNVEELRRPANEDSTEIADEWLLPAPGGGIYYTIPLGQATKNALLAHLGPQVPVRFSSIGAVNSTITQTVEEAGINNVFISLNILFEVDAKIVIPFATETKAVTTEVPIGVVYVQGVVPEFFSDGGGGLLPIAPTYQRSAEENP